MAAYIHNIATVVPERSYRQDFLREQMKKYIGQRDISRHIIHRIYAKSGIKKRHTVIDDFRANGDPRVFFQQDGSLSTPSTGKRNQLYIEKAKPLWVKTARKTIEENPSVNKTDITHIITVSCTGFFAPEPGFEIIKELNLSSSTERFHLGFMGCFAAFPAMKMAQSFCAAQPDANVLIVCLELCTLHLQNSEATDHLISASVFADGAAGLIVSARQPVKRALKLEHFSTTIAEETEEDMAWTIGDTGFEMVLSSYVPDLIKSNLSDAIQPLLEAYHISLADINRWAVHPGGRAILDKVHQSCNLQPEQLAASRKVLANYGNMSSATILFVLKELLDSTEENNKTTTLALAFGPGLTIESALLTTTDPA
ncbi:type III polyketide synthase [Aliifodinibius sp. 1BSP15-2V2]|uniref:Type III polyketide synthase n=2 Tax=Fodinibius salsisoli TaxID=2820877 RepID=A0ABT3PNL2_9BACT|nr:type III polyketide synthase [Fodinibius salsisoli]